MSISTIVSIPKICSNTEHYGDNYVRTFGRLLSYDRKTEIAVISDLKDKKIKLKLSTALLYKFKPVLNYVYHIIGVINYNDTGEDIENLEDLSSDESNDESSSHQGKESSSDEDEAHVTSTMDKWTNGVMRSIDGTTDDVEDCIAEKKMKCLNSISGEDDKSIGKHSSLSEGNGDDIVPARSDQEIHHVQPSDDDDDDDEKKSDNDGVLIKGGVNPLDAVNLLLAERLRCSIEAGDKRVDDMMLESQSFCDEDLACKKKRTDDLANDDELNTNNNEFQLSDFNLASAVPDDHFEMADIVNGETEDSYQRNEPRFDIMKGLSLKSLSTLSSHIKVANKRAIEKGKDGDLSLLKFILNEVPKASDSDSTSNCKSRKNSFIDDCQLNVSLTSNGAVSFLNSSFGNDWSITSSKLRSAEDYLEEANNADTNCRLMPQKSSSDASLSDNNASSVVDMSYQDMEDSIVEMMENDSIFSGGRPFILALNMELYMERENQVTMLYKLADLRQKYINMFNALIE